MPDERREINQHAARLLKTHRTLLEDETRNRAFFEALKQNVTNESVVLDIGSGTGIWTFAAASLGAKRVVAIEADEFLSNLIKKLAVEKGFSDRIEVICDFSQKVPLAREFNIVVSETIGYIGFDENIVEIMADARTRFLRDDGVMIPKTVSLNACLGKYNCGREEFPAGIAITLDGLSSLDMNRPRVLKRNSEFEALTKPVCLVETDLTTAFETPNLQNLKAIWSGPELSRTNSILLWVESRLTNDVKLDTRKTTSWFPNLYLLGNAVEGCDEIEIEISLSPENSEWSASFRRADSELARTFSLDFLADSMKRSTSERFELRAAGEPDLEFRQNLFAASRATPLLVVGWDEDTIRAFLASQFDLRERAYRAQFADAEISIVMVDGVSVGCMIVGPSPESITLVDIEIAPSNQGKGLATKCIRMLQAEAEASRRYILLHVERENQRAFRLYQKLNFEIIDDESAHIEMIWRPGR